MAKIEEEVQSLKESLAKKDAQIERMLSILEARNVGPVAMSEDEKVLALTEDLKGKDRPKPKERRLATTSERTAATFELRVIESNGFPEGRIVELLNYKMPVGHDKNVRDGGLVPDGVHIYHPTTAQPMPEFKAWTYDTFWGADLKAYVGRPLSSRDLDNRDDIKSPWKAYESFTAEPVKS